MSLKYTLIISLVSLVLLLGYGYNELSYDETYENLYGEIGSGEINDLARPYNINVFAVPINADFDVDFMRSYFNYMTGGNFTFKPFVADSVVKQNKSIYDMHGNKFTAIENSTNWYTRAFKLAEDSKKHKDVGCILFVNQGDYDLLTNKRIEMLSRQHFMLVHEIMHCHALYYSNDIKSEMTSYDGVDIWDTVTDTKMDSIYNEFIHESMSDIGAIIHITNKYGLSEIEYTQFVARFIDYRTQKSKDKQGVFFSDSAMGHYTAILLEQLRDQYTNVKEANTSFYKNPVTGVLDLIVKVDRAGISKRDIFKKVMEIEFNAMIKKYSPKG